jgi:hypothetical protein
MQPSDYAGQFGDISEGLADLCEKMQQPDYCEKTPYSDFIRDVSIALELGQKEVDLFSEMIDDIGSDMQYFNDFCKRYDEQHRQQ